MTGRRGRETSRTSRWIRWRQVRRWSLPSLALVVLAASMAISVRRAAEARGLSDDVQDLTRAELVLREQVAAALRRADSLQDRARLDEAARLIGLRPARDSEIIVLADVAPVEDVR